LSGKNYLSNAIENSIWAISFIIVGIGVCRLLPEFEGLGRGVILITVVGIASYLVFLAAIDIPMYLMRWGLSAPILNRYARWRGFGMPPSAG
jgi:hypothetical protein